MRVWLDPNRLAALKLTATDVAGAIRAQNVQATAGALGAPPFGDVPRSGAGISPSGGGARPDGGTLSGGDAASAGNTPSAGRASSDDGASLQCRRVTP